MLATAIYYVWRERNARLHGDAPHNISVVYSDIIKSTISKVNPFCNIISLDTNRRLYILWGFSDDISS
jgi:hypothetical protein